MWIKTVSGRKIMGVMSVLLAVSVMLGLIAGQYVSSATADRRLPIYSVDISEKKVAITFDAAWSDQDTEELIDILEKHKATATFFIVGDWAEKFPDDVRAFYEAGHTVANHSDTHKLFSKCTEDEIRQEITGCNEKLKAITGESATLIRVPSGDYTDASLQIAGELGMTVIQWSVDSLDYQGLSVEEIVERVVPSVENGSIILFHNGVDNTAEALDVILTRLSAEGYSFVSVEDMIYKENYYLDHTGKQHRQV